jgi:protoporphyrinogen oxidase
MHVNTLILGAGISGLAASLRAKELGMEAVILEARPSAGGLLDSFEIEGFIFDNAVHLSFATEKKVREVFDATPYITHSPISYCHDGMWLKYPIQNNLYPLDVDSKIKIIKSFFERPQFQDGDNYLAWLESQYGKLFTEKYSVKYTKKYWGVGAEHLSTTWLGSRVRPSNPEEILYGAFSEKTPHYYYTEEMRYPEKGGYKAFIAGLIAEADIHLNKNVIEINLKEKLVICSDNSEYRYERLISSIPLPVLVSLTKNCDQLITSAAKKLSHTSMDLISIGFSEVVTDKLWFYIYDDDILASRAYSPSVKSKMNAPENCSSLQFEIYQKDSNQVHSEEVMLKNSLHAIKKLGLADEKDIVFMDHRRQRWANIIFYPGMEIDRNRIREYFLSSGVSTIGRFGEWDYLWSNQSFMSGYQVL